MRKIRFGRTNEMVSAVSLGTWAFGGSNMSEGRSVGWSGQKDSDSTLALVAAWENGINHWDTADVYGDGHSEQVIGNIWNKVPRNDIFLATKVGWDKGGFSDFYHPTMIKKHFERSLVNLKTDVIDLYYLHHCNFISKASLEDALSVIQKFKDDGKIRFIGLSDYDLVKIMKYIDLVNPDVIQPYRNVMDDTYESSGLKFWVENNDAGIAFFSPIKNGLLTGKYSKPVEFEEGDFRTNVDGFQDAALIEKIKDNKQLLDDKFSDHPQPVLHGLLGALLEDSPTGCVLLGQRNVGQVLAAAELGEAVSSAEAVWIKELYKK